MKIIFLGGINGSGKTTVIQKLREIKSIEVFHGTVELMKLLGIASGDYNALRRMSDDIVNEVWYNFFHNLSSLGQANEVAIVTAHYVKIFNGEIQPSYGPWYKYCRCLIFLWSPASSILRRILRDEELGKRKNRALFGECFLTFKEQEKFLERAQILSVAVMRQVSSLFQVPCCQIKNLDSKIERTIEELCYIIERL